MRIILASFLIITWLSACSDLKPYDPSGTERKYFFHSVRQLPPEPVYNRLSYVRPPDPLPDEAAPSASADTLRPRIQLEIANSTLGRAAGALASSIGYQVFVDPEIASLPYSCNMSGSIEVLANNMAEQVNADVVVDNEQRQIRFSVKNAVIPRLEEGGNEHQSNN